MRTLLLTLALVLALAGTAHAGSYTVTPCTGWAPYSSVATLSAGGTCPAVAGGTYSGLLAATVIGNLHTASGSTAYWRLQAPPGLRIDRLAVERFLGVRVEGWVAKVVTQDGRLLERCDFALGVRCERGGPGPANAVVFDGLDTEGVFFAIECSASGPVCHNGLALRNAWVAVYRATARMRDPAPPVVKPLAGSVVAGGWHRGTDTATVSAADASGIKRLRLLAGATELARRDQRCDFGRMQPCPGEAAATFAVDLPDGTHELRAIATDAADQDASARVTLRVDRTAPAGPAELAATPAADGSVTLSWTNPGSASPIVAAHYALCDGETCGAPVTVRGAGIERIEGVRWDSGTLQVWLEDEAGNVDRRAFADLPFEAGARPAPRVVDLNPPVLTPSERETSPRLKLTRARRSGATLRLSGTVARGATARISATAKRGRATARRSTRPRRGKWSLTLRLTPALRRAGTLSVTIRYAGQSGWRAATVRKRVAAGR